MNNELAKDILGWFLWAISSLAWLCTTITPILVFIGLVIQIGIGYRRFIEQIKIKPETKIASKKDHKK